ncbi:MAG: hypothetical protein KJ042_07840, partial [Deltaproteobacteria bacterium]|nr:hypothetical protein [Deltaproteobacteria bacterium]
MARLFAIGEYIGESFFRGHDFLTTGSERIVREFIGLFNTSARPGEGERRALGRGRRDAVLGLGKTRVQAPL